ncbi:KaiA family protein [Okeanomitos corallinicola TIOX110]|uniref:Circadian clock oscillator protein KaiA n=1 Tax=Okeanomitos corallinicola TIOX110 TaxID=3133117 RepID=A0ABZ2UXF7_9CYAN
MILPVLLICPQQIKKYLDHSYTENKLQSLTDHVKNFIHQTYHQLFNWQLTFITHSSHYLIPSKLVNDNPLLIHNDKYFQILACHEQKNQQIFQEMSPAEKQQTLRNLKLEYREILIDYFVSEQNLKIKIDKFINTLFCANIPVPQIIKIHMELIDEFSKQLKLEGRSDETLLDYRLTLIDILANLCEAYRSAISKHN